jgi:hypothetical protein
MEIAGCATGAVMNPANVGMKQATLNNISTIDDLPEWGGSIPTFGDDLPTIGKQPMPEPEKAPLPHDPDPRHLSRVEKRRMVEMTMGENATTKLAALPGPGESLHVRMDGSFNGFDFIPAMLNLMAPATITTLHIASLSFNRRVSERLLELMDRAKVRRVVYLSSSMFEGKERHLVDWLAQELAARGSALRVARNHTKLILAHTTDARHIVCEGSFNQRTCSCFEQATFTDDAALYDWHRKFIEEVV